MRADDGPAAALARLGRAAALVVGAGSIAGNELDGGPLGVPLFLGYLALIVWILAASVVLWRGRPVAVVRATRNGLTPA